MPFGSLWLQVIVSAVVVFVASSVLHMALKYHKADHRQLPGEDQVRDVLGRGNPAPGVYMTPYCSDMKQLKEPATIQKFEKGPIAIVTVLPKGRPNMGKNLGLWFGFCVLVSFTAAYVARHTLAPAAGGLEVMRITGAVAFAAYAYGEVMDFIWKGQPASNTARQIFDAAVYAILTGLVFRSMWPAA